MDKPRPFLVADHQRESAGSGMRGIGDVVGIFDHIAMRTNEGTVEEHPQFRECAVHGKYPISMVDAAGVVRWSAQACPACLAQAEVSRLMANACVSRRHAGCTFDNFVTSSALQREALDTCRNYAERFQEHLASGSSLILSGRPGTGKTHLASAIARTLLGQGHSVLMTTAYEMVLRIRKSWNNPNEDEDAVTGTFAKPDLLILDEVGKQYGSDSELVHIFHVIDRRSRDMRPTLLISNESPEGMIKYVGFPVFDRLTENGGVLVEFEWGSHRSGG